MKNITDYKQAQNNALSQEQKESKANRIESAAVSKSLTVTVGDTTIRLSFNGRDSISTQLANAFSTMLK